MYKTWNCLLLVMALASMPLLTGCAGSKDLGTHGLWNYRSVHASHLLTPNVTVMIKIHTETGQVVELGQPLAGQAIGPVIAKGALGVASSAVYGHSLEPDEGDRINTNLSNDSGSRSGAAAGAVNNNSNTNNNTSEGGGGPPFGNGPNN